MLQSGRLLEFITELIQIINEETNEKAVWEYYLHRVYDKSFVEFMAENERAAAPDAKIDDIETTVQKSQDILKNFEIK